MVAESGGPYPSHLPPLVQQPSRGNTSFHSPTEGHVDDTTHLDYVPNAPVGVRTLKVPNFGNSAVFVEFCKRSCDSK